MDTFIGEVVDSGTSENPPPVDPVVLGVLIRSSTSSDLGFGEAILRFASDFSGLIFCGLIFRLDDAGKDRNDEDGLNFIDEEEAFGVSLGVSHMAAAARTRLGVTSFGFSGLATGVGCLMGSSSSVSETSSKVASSSEVISSS